MSHNTRLLVTFDARSVSQINFRIYLERILTGITDHIADMVLHLGGNIDSLATARMSEVRGIQESCFVRQSNLTESGWAWIQANANLVPIHALLSDALLRLNINIKPFSTLCAYKEDPSSEVDPDELMPISKLDSVVSEFIDTFKVREEDGHRLKELLDVLKRIRESPYYLYKSPEC
ncbi:hypothetical protein BDD12DRAFT_811103 [Trichophaea hybrida]|nr:hypothetical protein BDD12DRAFT_811103 [Trichophaea hybrida]